MNRFIKANNPAPINNPIPIIPNGASDPFVNIAIKDINRNMPAVKAKARPIISQLTQIVNEENITPTNTEQMIEGIKTECRPLITTKLMINEVNNNATPLKMMT